MQMSVYVVNLFVGTAAGVFQTRGSPVEFTHSVACLLKNLLGVSGAILQALNILSISKFSLVFQRISCSPYAFSFVSFPGASEVL